MSDLTEFLLECIAEDEVAARAAAHVDFPRKGGAQHPFWAVYRDTGDYDDALSFKQYPSSEARAADAAEIESHRRAAEPDEVHIQRHDPARVLAGCESRRAIVEFCREPMIWVGHGGTPATDNGPADFVPGGRGSHESLVLKLMALEYTDRPGYREEWRS